MNECDEWRADKGWWMTGNRAKWHVAPKVCCFFLFLSLTNYIFILFRYYKWWMAGRYGNDERQGEPGPNDTLCHLRVVWAPGVSFFIYIFILFRYSTMTHNKWVWWMTEDHMGTTNDVVGVFYFFSLNFLYVHNFHYTVYSRGSGLGSGLYQMWAEPWAL